MGNIFRKNKEARVLMRGLDAVGKTSILYRLKLGEVVTTIPTMGFNVETITLNHLALTVWDMGSRDNMLPLHRHYYPNTQVIIFVVDSCDTERMDEVKYFLDSILVKDELRDVTVLVLANKQDLPNAQSVAYVAEALQLYKIKNKCNIIGTSAMTGDGLSEALGWISSVVDGTDGEIMKEILVTDKTGLEQGVGENLNQISGYLWKSWEAVCKLFSS